ncbi:MAG: hypothetical protein VYC34_00720, partial [Planctomycetota bacterium]|nr:hypothetical protein [Planctomycetota bacterium]
AAATAGDLVFAGLLQRERCARLEDFHRRDGEMPNVEEVVGAVTERLFDARGGEAARLGAIRRALQGAFVSRLISAALDERAAESARAALTAEMMRLRAWLEENVGAEGITRAHRAWLAGELARAIERPFENVGAAPAPADAPPGSPIGGGLMDWATGCSVDGAACFFGGG